jgi:hypothetical protein
MAKKTRTILAHAAALIWSTTGSMLSEHSDADDRTSTSIEEFTDAQLSAILRSRLKIVTIENDEGWCSY